MIDIEAFLHDLNQVTDYLQKFERAVEKDDLLMYAIEFQEAKDYFINTWCPQDKEEE